jgi:hypothetical protein
MVFASIAQSYAFDYKSFIDSGKRKGTVFKNIGYVLNVKDVLSDAHNTFVSQQKQIEDHEKQLQEEIKSNKAFNWSDEDAV